MGRKIADLNLLTNAEVVSIWAIPDTAECFTVDDVLIRNVIVVLGVSFSCNRRDRFTLSEPEQKSGKRRWVHRECEGEDNHPKQSQSKSLLGDARWHLPTLQRIQWVPVEISP